ncbi:PhzF family phenazine biosynthesis protein [Phaeobacter gallaeciensis]|uniref:Phenazine biosynthesis protein n=1 Tax=Phaeobacter gallaeciensis TaxID=60890 RepID=A0AAD0EAJ4_9RHOB|nr:PhzF family phenazine biosynthesis protein [Phaeobacter gallaeciensis]AHD08684.1 phenazine biosynthesis protein PhzF family [Phaeobacter gallaeciensis DSM 26640]ATE91950.1 phenazine biosynthesis protein [Phaeobacter gallaeciensis]ATE98226.1 phenazine biosynthesis protein [Phaeobacter gallaeciensis]ATF00566.1 phenazine biosynthesis protein [Phaeobacter gallaeciensis]ATF04997.1 phenazine biosynthesis protein [Phaeobacter gallaeciensis]
MRYDFDWVDAFSARAFGGNGCAVVHGGAELSDETCMAYVRETSLVECTFTGPSDVADLRVRYFLASREIPFAGHPTIATVAALRDRGLMTGDAITLETGAGLVRVTTADGLIEMTQVAPEFGAFADPALVSAAVSLPVDSIIGRPQKVSTGLPFCITVLRDRASLEAAQLDIPALTRLGEAMGADGIDMMEPFLVTLDGATAEGDTFSRLLMAPPSPPEDPFTGSATGAMAAYLWHHGLMEPDRFIAEQGHGLGRPGQAVVTRVGPADAPSGIRVAGRGYVLMRGTLDLPDVS